MRTGRTLLEEFHRKKEKFTVEFPFQPSRRWQQFFSQNGELYRVQRLVQPALLYHRIKCTLW